MVVVSGCEEQYKLFKACIIVSLCISVSGEANFPMSHMGLTVGSSIQPAVAQELIEHPSNIEKGLCQRFLWIAPKPNPTLFDELQCIDKDFTTAIGESYMTKDS